MTELEREYRAALLAHAAAPDEEGRERAYGLGRAAISAGLGVLDVTRMHSAALDANPDLSRGAAAWEFLWEALAPFEMALRGFRDANRALREAATTLEQRVAMRTAELERMQQTLISNEKVLRSILNSMSDGVAVADRHGRFVMFNPAGQRLVGPPPDGAEPEAWSGAFGVFEPDEKTPMPSEQLPLVRALAGEDVRDEELFVRNAHAPQGVHLSASASPLHDDAGHARGAVIVFRDTTARRRAEEAQKKAEERLVRAQKLDAIGQLAGGVAHDFNNLLAVISSYASLLLEDLPAEDPRAGDVREIAKAARSAASLTRQLLAFSRQQVLKPQVLDLNEVVADVSGMLRRTIGEHITLATSLDARAALALVDRGQLEQILMNLAVNARDAMPDGGRLMIETRMAELDGTEVIGRTSISPGTYVVLSVTDTGTGMDEATKARIFEPFFTTKPVGRGTGLGLAMVYGIVQQSRGFVHVYSELGKGTSVKIYLPRAPSERPPAAVTPSARPGSGYETILLVEDEESVRRVAVRVLRGAGYHVLEAEGPEAARQRSASHRGPIHLLLTDVVMPEGTGPELALELQRARPDMRVIFASGYSAAGIVHQRALPADAAFVEKPFNAESLRAKVRAVLDGGEGGA